MRWEDVCADHRGEVEKGQTFLQAKLQCIIICVCSPCAAAELSYD